MTVHLTASDENVLGFLLKGKLTEEDYTGTLVPALEDAIELHGTIRVLLEVRDFQGWTPGGAWEDLKHWPKMLQVERMALVSDESWDEVLTWMMKAFAAISSMDVHFYRIERLTEAWDWLRETAG